MRGDTALKIVGFCLLQKQRQRRQKVGLDDAERSRWGSYYEHQPRVVAAPLSSANESIRERTQFAAIREHYASTIADMARHLTPPALNGSSLAP